MMDALIEQEDTKEKLEGKRILENVAYSIQAAKQRQKEEEMKEDEALAEGVKEKGEGEGMLDRFRDED